MQLFILADKFCRPAGRQIGVVRDGLGDLEAGGIGHVVLQHIQNEPFFNGLPHTVNVEGVMAAVRVLGAEQLQRGGFWGGGKGEEGQVLVPPVGGQFLHQCILRVDLVLRFAFQLGIFPQRVLGVGKGGFQLQSRGAGLGGVRFVDDDGIVLPGGLVYLSIDDRELLQRGDDDACAVVDGIPQVAGVFVLADGLHRTQRMVEAGDGLLQLCVQHGAVSNHDDAGKHRLVLGVEQGSQPVRRPSNGVGLARPGAVLDEIVLPGTLLPHICHQLAHHVQLMVPGKDQGLAVLQAHKLLQDIHHAVLLEHFFPEVGGKVAVGVGRIACTAVPPGTVGALIEGQKACVLACQPGGHPHLGQVYAKVAQNALVELETHLPGVPVVHPLLLGVFHGLPGELVLQLKGEHRDAVYRQHHVHRVVGGVGVEPLPVAGDLVLSVALGVLLVQRGLRLKIAHPEPPSPVLEPIPQHRKQPVRIAGIVKGRAELPHRVYRVLLFKKCPLVWLGLLHKADQGVYKQPQLGVVAIPVAGVAPGRGEQRRRNVRFKLLFGGVEGHG